MKKDAPSTYESFLRRYPALGEGWDAIRRAEEASGPLDRKSRRLVKLGVAIGAHREGAVHSAVRKARDAGASTGEIFQVVALAASTIGLPSAVAAYTWLRDLLEPDGG